MLTCWSSRMTTVTKIFPKSDQPWVPRMLTDGYKEQQAGLGPQRLLPLPQAKGTLRWQTLQERR